METIKQTCLEILKDTQENTKKIREYKLEDVPEELWDEFRRLSKLFNKYIPLYGIMMHPLSAREFLTMMKEGELDE